MSTALQNSQFDSGDTAIAQNTESSPLESALGMNDEQNVFSYLTLLFFFLI